MTLPRLDLVRAAIQRIHRRTATLALLGNAVLLLLGWAWLLIPDAHVYQFLFSAVLAAALLAGFFALHATLIRRLNPPTFGPLWRGALLLAAWVLLGHILQHLTSLLLPNVETRAGYWNSQLSAHHRAFFTYQRLSDWQNLAIEAICWIVIPALLLPFAVATVSCTARIFVSSRAGSAACPTASAWRTAARTLARPQLWLAVAAAYILGSWLGSHVLAWHPLHSVTGELISVGLRTLFVYCLAVALLLFTLATVSELLARTEARTRRNPAA